MRRPALHILLLIAGFFAGEAVLFAQHASRPARLYDPDLNQLLFPGNSKESWNKLFSSFDTLIIKGDRSIHFLQIGDSHIQAGFLPEQLNKELTGLLAPGCGGRGFIFPYRVAKSNNPLNYSIRATGNWNHCRNVEVNRNCDLGLAGIMVSSADSVADIHLLLKPDPIQYDFNRIRIYHDTSTRFGFGLPALEGHYSETEPAPGITDFQLDCYVDSLWMRICRRDTMPGTFFLYGLEVMNGDPGIIFSSVGVNGAEFASFLNCNLLGGQLKVVSPQCVIVSLGTNDAYGIHFNRDTFEQNARQLVRNLKRTLPGVAILLTTPGDSYRKRRTDNKNLLVVRETLLKIAADEDCAVWDFYSLMGGPSSMMTWYKAGLTAKDKIHFSRTGYYIQGDLLFQAIRDAWFSTIDNNYR